MQVQIRHGLVSCDSHAQLDRDAFTSRMSAAKWGDRIPQVVEVENNGRKVHRWAVNGKPAGGGEGGGVANCPALMENHRTYPQRWEDVPRRAYDPLERLEALDEDGVDAEVLFPNAPVSNWSFAAGGPEFELGCIEATNDALGEWRQVSDRYIPLAIVPYLCPIEQVVAQVERAVERGHRGITMPAEPGLCLEGARSLYDPFWNPLWDACQELGIPVNWHGSAGLAGEFSLPRWKGYTPRQTHTVSTARLCATPTQLLPALMLSGILDRYPRLKFACAETGSGWMAHVLESCDHEWERRHLWTEGVLTRPSEAFRRQIYVDFWFERSGLELRDFIGVDNIMWESDYPHITSTYPNSRTSAARLVDELPEEDRRKLLYENTLRLYGL
jgi:predicted TIM-barrel fold metal-dependent hydrolase